MGRDILKDLEKLAAAYLYAMEYCPRCEFGCVGTDCKRPFGNTDVLSDILEIIEWAPEQKSKESPGNMEYSYDQEKYAVTLFTERLIPFLQKEWGKRRLK